MKAMVLTGSGTFDPEVYAEYAKTFPANTKGEIRPGEEGVLKFHSSNDAVRKGMIDLVSRSDADIYVAAYIKEGGKHPKKPVRIYADLYELVLRAAASETDAKDIRIILDESNYISLTKARNIAKDVFKDRSVSVEMMKTKDNLFLQTNEFATGPASFFIETEDHMFIEPLKSMIRFWKTWSGKR